VVDLAALPKRLGTAPVQIGQVHLYRAG